MITFFVILSSAIFVCAPFALILPCSTFLHFIFQRILQFVSVGDVYGVARSTESLVVRLKCDNISIMEQSPVLQV